MNSSGQAVKVYLGLGSNKGNRKENLTSAINLIIRSEGIKFIRSSLIYETEPWGIKEQNSFLNCVIEIETSIPPLELLHKLKETEVICGRTLSRKWEEREIDIDILFYGEEIIKTDSLQIPHPEIPNRRFVLEPMNELNGKFIHPVYGIQISKLIETTKDTGKVIEVMNISL